MNIGIINYGISNINSVIGAIKNLGFEHLIIESINDFDRVNKLSYYYIMKYLLILLLLHTINSYALDLNEKALICVDEEKYKNNNICAPKEAVSAKIKFSLEPGGIQKYLNSREMIKCWAYDTYKERSDKIIQGKALK